MKLQSLFTAHIYYVTTRIQEYTLRMADPAAGGSGLGCNNVIQNQQVVQPLQVVINPAQQNAAAQLVQ